MPDMINPQKGIDLMNNTSIINRILFAVTIFQQVSILCFKIGCGCQVFYKTSKSMHLKVNSTTWKEIICEVAPPLSSFFNLVVVG
jgi:hypothetical protein